MADPIPVAALNAMGCLPPIYKSVDVLSLRTQLYAVLQQPMPALRNDAVVSLAREQSHELEQLHRLQRSMLHVIIYGASRVLSSGLKQHLRGIAQMMEAGHPDVLRLAREQLQQLAWLRCCAPTPRFSASAWLRR